MLILSQKLEDNLDALSGARWFSILDCNMVYYQVPLEESDKCKTAFATPMGGLQLIAERVLKGLQWHIAVLYRDDMTIYSTTFEEHLADLQKVFDRLLWAG